MKCKYKIVLKSICNSGNNNNKATTHTQNTLYTMNMQIARNSMRNANENKN